MAYIPTNWENLPSTNTPINQTNLNNIETGIQTNENQVIHRVIEAGTVSVSSKSTEYSSFTIPTVSGYTCIFVTLNYMSGAGNGNCIVVASTTGNLTVYNGGTGSATPNIRLTAVYLKN